MTVAATIAFWKSSPIMELVVTAARLPGRVGIVGRRLRRRLARLWFRIGWFVVAQGAFLSCVGSDYKTLGLGYSVDDLPAYPFGTPPWGFSQQTGTFSA